MNTKIPTPLLILLDLILITVLLITSQIEDSSTQIIFTGEQPIELRQQ